MNERIQAYDGKEPYIFVSYAHKNSNKVMPIINSLFNDKYRVWYDEGIAPGSEWPKNIEDHLKAASVILVFTSKESLESLNCQNEIVNAINANKEIYVYSLDNSDNEKLVNYRSVTSYSDLKSKLNDELIGDGISGYRIDLGKTKNGNYWTGLMVFAFVLVVVLALSIFGLNEGWFNDMLPGLNEPIPETVEKQEVVTISDNALTHAIASETNNIIIREVSFKSADTKKYLYELLNIDENTSIMYQDLVGNDSEELIIEFANDELLEYMQYFSNLKTITILDGDITSLDSLLQCAHLKIVKITNSVLPLNIPQEKLFEVEYIGQ